MRRHPALRVLYALVCARWGYIFVSAFWIDPALVMRYDFLVDAGAALYFAWLALGLDLRPTKQPSPYSDR